MIRPPRLLALVALASLIVLLVAGSGPARAQTSVDVIGSAGGPS